MLSIERLKSEAVGHSTTTGAVYFTLLGERSSDVNCNQPYSRFNRSVQDAVDGLIGRVIDKVEKLS